MRLFVFHLLLVIALGLGFAAAAHAEFIVTSAIVEFKSGGARQQDIELVSRSRENQYIVSEVSEVRHPGMPNESRIPVEDPAEGGLLVTPDKTVLPPQGRKTLRFVALENAPERERVYRVAVRPVIRGMESDSAVGLKVLVGYEVLVIVRPAQVKPSFTTKREGKTLSVTNDGNTNILLQNGKQCAGAKDCATPPPARIYAGETLKIALPKDAPVTYSVWDGKQTVEKEY